MLHKEIRSIMVFGLMCIAFSLAFQPTEVNAQDLDDYFPTYMEFNISSFIMMEPDYFSDKVNGFAKGDSLLVLGFKVTDSQTYFKVRYNESDYYAFPNDFKLDNQLKGLNPCLKVLDNPDKFKTCLDEIEEFEIRVAKFADHWAIDKRKARMIIKGKIEHGFSSWAVEQALGRPDSYSHSTRWGTEMWVYRDEYSTKYVFFEDDEVVNIKYTSY